MPVVDNALRAIVTRRTYGHPRASGIAAAAPMSLIGDMNRSSTQNNILRYQVVVI